MSARLVKILNQKDSFMELVRVTAADALSEPIYKVARQIKMASRCDDRDDICELKAVYDTVKNGDERIPGMERGLRYISDPQTIDYFIRPKKMLSFCAEGACAEDCDSHAALVASILIAMGFRAGLRAYGPKKTGAFSHVYAVAMLPKISVNDVSGVKSKTVDVIGMDTTVPSASVGWQPPPGRVMTAWILGQGITIEGIRR